MDAIMDFSCLQSLLPLARSLVEIVQQVIALTALVQLFCIFLLKDRKRLWKDKCFWFGKSHGLFVLKCLNLKRGHAIGSQRMWHYVGLRFQGYLQKISSEWMLWTSVRTWPLCFVTMSSFNCNVKSISLLFNIWCFTCPISCFFL